MGEIETQTIKRHTDNIKTLISHVLRSTLDKQAMEKLNDAIEKVIGNRKTIVDLPKFLLVRIGETLTLKQENNEKQIIVNTYKIHCTCIDTEENFINELIDEREEEENNITITYIFYLSELLRILFSNVNFPDVEQKKRSSSEEKKNGARKQKKRNSRSK